MASASTFFSATRNTGLDFKTLLESHAYISHLKANKKTADIKRFLLHGTSPEFEHLRFDVSWENARLEFQDPEWTFPVNDVHDSSRKNNETWDFEKSVSNFEVTNEYTDETKAVFKLSWLEGNTFGLDLNTTLELPTEAKEVFGETTVLNINGPSFETHCDQKSKNSVKVPVLANQATTLVTTHRERNFKGTFTSKAFLGGKVSVRISNTKKNELIRTVTDDVIDVFRQMSQEMSHFSNSEKSKIPENSVISRLSPFEPCQALSEKGRVLIWKISGACHFNVGIHGSVKVESA
ncbi:hypothetical protein BsWGS_08136 [Bradybaena similaris]